MKRPATARLPYNLEHKRLIFVTAAVLFFLAFSAHASGQSQRIDGYTEPYRSVNIATTEMGVIAEVLVKEGETVTAGQAVANLDRDLQAATLAIAKKNFELTGRVAAAKAEATLRSQRLSKLEQLARAGHARREEVERARADANIARSQHLAAEEEQIVRQLEYQRALVQIKRRTITSPLSGVIAEIIKRDGEFVAPNDPQIMRVVQLDKLQAKFTLNLSQSRKLSQGQIVKIEMGGKTVAGEVEFVAPVADAESGTVLVKVRVPNERGQLSGQRVSLQLP